MRNRSRPARSPVSVWTLVALLAVGASASDGTAQETSAEAAFGETVEVRVVNVDVHVVDRKGRPVSGLTRGDFELLVDGRPVEITYFLAVGEQRTQGTAVEKNGAAVADEAPGAAHGAPSESRLILFVDQMGLRPAGRKRVLEDVARFVGRKLVDGDRVMVASYDRGLQVPLAFTRNLAAVEPVLAEMLEAPALGTFHDRAYQQALERIEEAPSCVEGINTVRAFAAASYAEQAGRLAALGSLVASLTGLPGPKQLLYISDGLEVRTSETLCELLANRCPAQASQIRAIPSEYSHLGALRALAGRANARRVTFYPLEALGLTVASSSDVERGPRTLPQYDDSGVQSVEPVWADSEPAFDPTGHGQPATLLDQVRTANRQGSLTFLAAATGGVAVLNANRFGRELARIEQRLRSYYSLGFEPAASGPGRRHRLEVRVRRPKVDVHHPTGYVEQDRDDRLADRLQAMLLYGATEENPLAARLELLSRRAAAGRRQTASFRLVVPRLAALPSPAGANRLLVLLASRSDRGRVSPTRRLEIASPAATEPLVHDLELTLEAGPQRLGAAVMDRATGLVSWLTYRLDGEASAVE